MPSFDVVSEVDMHEVSNAVDQARREVGTRFDFKGTDSKYELADDVVTLISESDFQIKQMLDILRTRLSKRNVDVGCLLEDDPVESGKTVSQKVTVRQGLDSDLCRKVVKEIKGAKLKVQSSIQGDRVRVSGKKRDDLQDAISLLKEKEFELPFQYTNFRD